MLAADVVGGARKVRDRVARRELQLFEIERVSGRHFRQRTASSVDERFCLLRSTVDRVHQLKLAHAEVVVCACFDRKFLDRRGGRVTTRFGNRYGRRLILENIDGVLRRGVHEFVLRPALELDPIEAVFRDLDGCR